FELEGSTLRGRLLHHDGTGYSSALRARLVAALPPAPTTLAEVGELDTLIGQEFGAAAAAAIAATGPVDLVCSHGQTVFHWVEGSRALGTLQIGEPAWIAQAAGAPVVSHVRIRDIVQGGQGAPLVSVMDDLLLSALPGRSAALNLGGISNVTIVGGGAEPVAYDIGPANALIDAVIVGSGANDLGYDADGAIAASGSVDRDLLAVLLDEPYYALPTPKSTGKELFHLPYVRAAIERAGTAPSTPDLLATLTELTVLTVAAEIRAAGVDTLVASGGGVRNPVIMAGLARELPGVTIARSDEFGAPSDAKEAIAFALIGWLTAHGLPGTVPSATGASAPSILGSITPGPLGFGLQPAVAPPTGLVLS
ncbi:MAG: anhydro-N-acetylmuramic acid kinase, partial [Microbacteriaceae bacterium]|nr:anhydro-N-acetylmuramic acid kinase [Microbacteriaceae bacterium]